MTKKQIKQLETAGKKLEKCGGDCHHCDKCHIYTRWTERAGYMAVGCDLLPSELYDYIAACSCQPATFTESSRMQAASPEILPLFYKVVERVKSVKNCKL